MSKEISVIIPDSYLADHVIERIKIEFDNDPEIIVLSKGELEKKMGNIVKAVGDFQKELSKL